MYLLPFHTYKNDPLQNALPVKGDAEDVRGNTNELVGDMFNDPVIFKLPVINTLLPVFLNTILG